MPSDNWFTDALKRVKSSPMEDFILHRLSVKGRQTVPRPIVKDSEYVTLLVRSSRIVNSRRWTSKLYGCIQSKAQYLHPNGMLECNAVVVPDLMKGIDPSHLDRVIQVNKRVLGPVPHRGDLSLQLGLFCVKGSDLAGPYIELLTTLSQQAGVTFMSQMMPFVEPLRKGADLLFGVPDQAQLEIGIDQNWTSLETGDWVMIRAPKGKVNVAALALDPNDFKVIDSKGQPFTEYPYVVFNIDGTEARDDWFLIPELASAWNAIGEAARKNQLNDAERLLQQFVFLCRWSPDLVPSDQTRLAGLARAKLPELQPKTGVSASVAANKAHPLGDLKGLKLYP